jgi:transposase-like protein
MKVAFVGEKNFDVIKMHGTTIKIQGRWKYSF